MGFAVELYLDSLTDAKVRRVWASLAEAGINSHLITVGARPHVSLAVFGELDPECLRADMQDFARVTPQFAFRLSSVGTFGSDEGVVYIAPERTQTLTETHRRYHERLARLGALPSRYYWPGVWRPHCTVAMHVTSDKIEAAVCVCQAADVLGEGRFTEIGLIEFGGTLAKTNHLYSFPLSGATAPV